MQRISRRALLRTSLGAASAAGLAVLGGQPASAAFSAPVQGRRYMKFGGANFLPISSFKAGTGTDWTYNDNGSIYLTGTPRQCRTRVQLPDGAVIEEIQFNYFLGSLPSMFFSIISFDGANGYDPNIPTVEAGSPDPVGIQTISLPGLPLRVDNSKWFYVLNWFPSAADTDHILWSARVGYRVSDNQQ